YAPNFFYHPCFCGFFLNFQGGSGIEQGMLEQVLNKFSPLFKKQQGKNIILTNTFKHGILYVRRESIPNLSGGTFFDGGVAGLGGYKIGSDCHNEKRGGKGS
ncbi:MAG: hypothetical protein K2O71_00495, partial [Lachnospiraceae bacterium]|nr:hypothetical protein [Lachnospiraceae bacterium]